VNIRFLDHFVTDDTTKARVSYSAGKSYVGPTGNEARECVTLYAKSFDDGDNLGRIFAGIYQNDTDLQTDYFDKGRVKLFIDHPLYEAAMAACMKAEKRWHERRDRRDAKREARRQTWRLIKAAVPLVNRCGPDCDAMMQHTPECLGVTR